MTIWASISSSNNIHMMPSQITIRILVCIVSQKTLERDFKFFNNKSSQYQDIFQIIQTKDGSSQYLSYYETYKMEWIKRGGKNENICKEKNAYSHFTYKNLMIEWEEKNYDNLDQLNLEQKVFDDRKAIRQRILAGIATNSSWKWHKNRQFSMHNNKYSKKKKTQRKRKNEYQEEEQENKRKKQRLNQWEKKTHNSPPQQ